MPEHWNDGCVNLLAFYVQERDVELAFHLINLYHSLAFIGQQLSIVDKYCDQDQNQDEKWWFSKHLFNERFSDDYFSVGH